MQYNIKLKLLKDECWYGGSVAHGFMMPLTNKSIITIDTTRNNTFNQASPLYLSNKGRYIWSEKGFKASFFLGNLKCTSYKAEIVVSQGHNDLKGAYLAASKKYFPPCGKLPNDMLFKAPQYNTWIKLDTRQSEAGILDYAHSIIKCGMPKGTLIIDDGWQTSYGDWDFNKRAFPSPKDMFKELKLMGFKLMLWICPFISTSCSEYNYLKDNNLLIKKADNTIAFRKWWNGVDALLDLSNRESVSWLNDKMDYLMETYGVDGFKLDAGDAKFYQDDDISAESVDANTQSELWAQIATNYDFNELRACFKMGGKNIVQRLADKNHSYNKFTGLGSLIPNAMIQGLLGYPYLCPDMIGGGQIEDFRREIKIDNELIIRYAQCSALMPMMQFSYDAWASSSEIVASLVKEASYKHLEYSEYILKLARESSNTGEPIVRLMEYVFPNQGFFNVKNQFMLGERYLVAPVIKRGEGKKKVRLPEGKWRSLTDYTVYEKVAIITPDIWELPIFEKIN